MSHMRENRRMPMTVNRLKDDLQNLGLQEGQVVLVHSSLSSIGWTSGGAVAVVQALMDVVTDNGTIVMPTHSGDLSDPEKWENPPVPKSWWQPIRESVPAFHPSYTPTYGMGVIVDVFRAFPNVLRSNHPAVSFAAWGKKREEIIDNHGLDFGLGEASPLARLYENNAYVLFIGTGYDTNTSFHLGEYRAPQPKIVTESAPVFIDGKRVWFDYKEIAYEDDEFEKMGVQFEKRCKVVKGDVGKAKSRLFSLVDAVDFSTLWFTNERKGK
ncbi:aminoglycoside N(3)-acetyltransferase [Evansella halocellulosilytica]|uniref:aminoglycoside N(3)-acetyltransferase n=1 Tax=Evansella halocellulosilytica TaxID=2011013 RepID=UPI000BB6F46C|nr:AAC(3) family N-acetyltransferase [Evansella halocellulosilytica]